MGNWQNISLDITVEKQKFAQAVDRLCKAAPKTAAEIVRDAAETFARSAQRETDPASGRANIPKKLFKRDIVTLNDPRYPNSRKRTRYRVRYRTPRKKGSKYFATLKDAREFSPIKYRGAGRAGWFGALIKLGIGLKNISATTEQFQVAAQYNHIVLHDGNVPAIEIANTSHGIGEYARKSEKWGIIKATNKINAAARQYEKKLAQPWK